MYDEIAKRLREAAEYVPCIMDREDAIKAADAIEELSNDYEKLAEDFNGAVGLLHKREKPRWIPVTERLPCLTTPVLATDGIEVDIAWMYGVPQRWITSFTAIDEDKLTHWMPLPRTPKGK